jgi:GNAT superfamily N-acetyltransferase
MHIEHSCRSACGFLPEELREPGHVRPRNWRAWILCQPPFDRNPAQRAVIVAYEHTDVLGFVAVVKDSLYGGYQADLAGLYVLPKYRRRGIGGLLLVRAAKWLQEDGISRATVDCFALIPARGFFDRMGGVVISNTGDPAEDSAAKVTYGFANLRELAARG